nr:hypothetical protein [Pirellulales bacterium]
QVVEEPAEELYDYPFVERVIEERAAPADIEVETEPSEFHEYSFDLPGVEYRVAPPEQGGALAYIVGAGAKPQAATGSPNFGRRDHLEPRRA